MSGDKTSINTNESVNQNGDKFWRQNDQYHRTDGPAIEFSNGDKFWYCNNKLHRVDGPAVVYSHGNKSWYIHGQKYSEKDFKIKINQYLEKDLFVL